ncbi:MAG: PQQ-dependent sugar dehydrogenase [Thermodesulfobacteriota bacterium]
MISRTALCLVLALLLPFAACRAGTAPVSGERTFPSEQGPLRVTTVAEGLEHPWGLAFLPDGRMLVTERPGRLRFVAPDGALSPPLAGVPQVYARGQGGLLDVALAPDFATSRLVYLTYAEPGEGGGGTAAGRGRLGEDRLEDFRVLFRQVPKSGGGRHFGSRLVFGRDGRLHLTTGDRAQQDWVQDTSIHRGQVIRLEADGAVPADNPFVGRPGYRPETYSLGHRNPQGAALHPETGELWLVDHGAQGGDEVNVVRAGRNYGWPVITYGRDYSGAKIGVGTHREGMEQPLYYWDPSIAPSGMAFVTSDLFPAWKGSLLVGALRGQMLVRLALDGEKVVGEERLLTDLGERIRDVRQGPDGRFYLLTDSPRGRLLRLEP